MPIALYDLLILYSVLSTTCTWHVLPMAEVWTCARIPAVFSRVGGAKQRFIRPAFMKLRNVQ